MSRVEKGGRSFRPVIKGSAATRKPTPSLTTPLQSVTGQDPNHQTTSSGLSGPSTQLHSNTDLSLSSIPISQTSRSSPDSPPTLTQPGNSPARAPLATINLPGVLQPPSSPIGPTNDDRIVFLPIRSDEMPVPSSTLTQPGKSATRAPLTNFPNASRSLNSPIGTQNASQTISRPISTAENPSLPSTLTQFGQRPTRVPLTTTVLSGVTPPFPIGVGHSPRTILRPHPVDEPVLPPSRFVRASSVMSTTSSIGSSMSAAEKMKLKAQAAKAARAEAKLRNPTPFRRSSSVGPGPTPPTPRAQTISVPTPPLIASGSAEPAMGGPIDATLQLIDADDSVARLTSGAEDGDIPVPTQCSLLGSSPVPAQAPSPSLPADAVANTNQKPRPKPRVKQAKRSKQLSSQKPSAELSNKKARAARKPKATLATSRTAPTGSIENENENRDEEDEDISPRLRRKRHLLKLRAEKQEKDGDQSSTPYSTTRKLRERSERRISPKLFNDSSEASGEEAQVEDRSFMASSIAGEEEAESGQKKRNRKGRKGLAVKRARKVKIKGLKSGSEEEDEDTPIDPAKMTLTALCVPEARRGRRSELLESRMKLVIERRDREKAERMQLRAERRKRKRQTPVERREKTREKEGEEGGEGEQECQEGEEEEGNGDRSAAAAKATRQSLAETYGLEELDSDDDMDNFEEVVFDEFAKSTRAKKNTPALKAPIAPLADIEEEEEEIVEEDYVPEARQYAPQLRVVDGQIVLDQDSLQVDRQEDQTHRLDEMEIVEENDATRLVNSHTWSRGIRGERWSAHETSLFFDAVRMFGSDFEMIAQLFPGRNRKQIRLKWIKEEKKAPDLMTNVMMGRDSLRSRSSSEPLCPIEKQVEEDGEQGGEIVELTSLTKFEEYAKLVGIDYTGPIPEDPMDKWREKERLEDEELRKQAATTKLKKTGEGGEGVNEDEDEDEEEEVVEQDFNSAGWGEF
ncbi:hypothetical protein CROQUDRAFT_663585 [Cronartium quercuum f. sp. fusiforme G11]|uniref:Myb-like domain-containing protein n=1 Tax=Cronartium quercuum f. sp. fusiforme G11 TaxID=708437 RepID=A0A9P6T7J2_9BASI|nr:hypothetical protein CROQUDRAFT_663585 [Cronartium quercuum f. sp. fusiforme G11]